MRIAIIAWGSLIWDPRSLPYDGDWQPNGPRFSVEFSRVSRDCRLTLVVDGRHGADAPTRFVTSTRRALHDAMADLRDREGTIWSRIGYVNRKDGSDSADAFAQPGDTFQRVFDWSEERGFDAAIWTALPPSFEKETGEQFSLEAATKYLQRLPKIARKCAVTYIEKAPPEVETPLRNYFAANGLIAPKEKWGVT